MSKLIKKTTILATVWSIYNREPKYNCTIKLYDDKTTRELYISGDTKRRNEKIDVYNKEIKEITFTKDQIKGLTHEEILNYFERDIVKVYGIIVDGESKRSDNPIIKTKNYD